MRHLLQRVLVCLGLLVSPFVGHCQQTPVVRYVILDDYVREYLAKEWDNHLKDRPMLERAYCLGYQLDIIGDELGYRVTQIGPVDSAKATTGSISYRCPGTSVHIHTPQTCIDAQNICWIGGMDAYLCMPSEIDQASLDEGKDKFALLQCDRHAVITYWPTKRPPSP